jgi:hypothetical protein
MNFFSAFTSEVFRPIVSLLIPGSIAISPWFIGLAWKYLPFREMVSKNETTTGLLLVLSATFVGLIIENLGSRIEDAFDSIRNNKSQGAHKANWDLYLRTCFRADPVGRRYARSIVLRLKFELATFWALGCAVAGLLWFMWLGLPLRFGCPLVAISLVLMVLNLAEAWLTHGVLSKTREELGKIIRIVG